MSYERTARRLSQHVVLGTLLISSAAHAVPVGKAILDPYDMRNYANAVRSAAHSLLTAELEVEVAKQDPPPPPEPESEAPKPPVEHAPKAEKAPAAPPAAAQAAKTLTADDEPKGPVDFTVVQGSATAYAGGVTASNGTSNSAVYDRGAKPGGLPGGTPGGTGTAPANDQSHPARPASLDWRCNQFPPEADADDINSAIVKVVVNVGADGAPSGVTVLSDPGHGFARAARTCALGQRFVAALGPDGKSVVGRTAPITVRFTR